MMSLIALRFVLGVAAEPPLTLLLYQETITRLHHSTWSDYEMIYSADQYAVLVISISPNHLLMFLNSTTKQHIYSVQSFRSLCDASGELLQT